MELKIITPPAAEPLTLAETKLHLRVDHTVDDTLITALIATAREWVESYTGKSLIEQTRQITLSSWPYAPLRLHGGPVQEISSVKYLDKTGTEQTVAETVYWLTPGGEISLDYGQTWPSEQLRGPDSIAITYVTGYEPVVTETEVPVEDGEEGETETITTTDYGGNVPRQFKQAMLLLIGTWYELREGVFVGKSTSISGQANPMIPFGVKEILYPLREVPL